MPSRKAKHLLSRYINKATSLQEYGLEQCAAASLGIPASYCSEKTVFCFIHPAIAFLFGETVETNTAEETGSEDGEFHFQSTGGTHGPQVPIDVVEGPMRSFILKRATH